MTHLVIGAGVVGLAIARTLAQDGHEVLILEREDHFGQMTSARNSGVLHAGLYHPPDWLKARLCVRGRRALVAYCAARGVAHRICGKLVVATEAAQVPALEAMAARGQANGVEGLRMVSGAEARAMEPALACEAALVSPATGIVDAHGLMLALLGEAEAAGARLVCRAEVTRVAQAGGWWHVTARSGGEEVSLTARCVVNAAGLGAQAVAIEGLTPPPLFLAKGSYFALSGPAPFSRLIYPVPVVGGAGVHLTLDLGGEARFGPDVEWVDRAEYRVEAARREAFAAEIRRYWPAVPAARLRPGMAGVRPKLTGPPEGGADFAIWGPARHGMAGLVALFGMESPGLTSCLAIGELVRDMLRE